MNAYVLDSVAQDRWSALLQRAWMARFAAARSDAGGHAEQRRRRDAAARLRERIRAYESAQPSYAADLAAALAQLDGA
ncbi:MAG TPA: hypothetical protein VFQ16_09635 [Burkholderiaceae bacterium]|nr:hypothetical protein [Burkholderiaceae bacterium]